MPSHYGRNNRTNRRTTRRRTTRRRPSRRTPSRRSNSNITRSSWVVESTGRPYHGRVVMNGNEAFTTHSGAMEGNSQRLTRRAHTSRTRTTPMSSNTNRRGMSVADPCPPGLYVCPDGVTCVSNLSECPEVSDCPSQGLLTCWDGSCASTPDDCPMNPNFNPGEGELPPSAPTVPRVPLGSYSQCYCECAPLGELGYNVTWHGMLGTCPSPGQPCDSQCSAYCESINRQLSWSMCYLIEGMGDRR